MRESLTDNKLSYITLAGGMSAMAVMGFTVYMVTVSRARRAYNAEEEYSTAQCDDYVETSPLVGAEIGDYRNVVAEAPPLPANVDISDGDHAGEYNIPM
jgi:hypothetical protein